MACIPFKLLNDINFNISDILSSNMVVFKQTSDDMKGIKTCLKGNDNLLYKKSKMR